VRGCQGDARNPVCNCVANVLGIHGEVFPYMDRGPLNAGLASVLILANNCSH
jgi:hypothetical protein